MFLSVKHLWHEVLIWNIAEEVDMVTFGKQIKYLCNVIFHAFYEVDIKKQCIFFLFAFLYINMVCLIVSLKQ